MKLTVAIFLLFVFQPAFSKFVHDSTQEDRSFSRQSLKEQLLALLDAPRFHKRSGETGYCHASGDPHYETFDGKTYDFMGACRYVQATDGCGTHSNGRAKLGTFKIIAENVGCGGSCSRVKSVEIHIGGELIHLQRGKTLAPAPEEKPGYSITHEGDNVVVRARSAGLTVKWDMTSSLTIELDQRYRGKVCGLCGNFDGNTANDFTTSTGVVTNDVDAFGVSWKAGGKCVNHTTNQHPCEENPGRRADAEKDCAVIKSDAFSECSAKMDVDPLYHDCVYDVCSDTETSMKESSCEAIREASNECKEKTGDENHVHWGHLEKKCRCLKTAYVGKREKCCVFPFVFRGRQMFDCVETPGSPLSWCSTVADLDVVQGPKKKYTGVCT